MTSPRDAYTPATLVVADLLDEARRPLELLEARLKQEGPSAATALGQVQLALANLKGAWMFYPVVSMAPRGPDEVRP